MVKFHLSSTGGTSPELCLDQVEIYFHPYNNSVSNSHYNLIYLIRTVANESDLAEIIISPGYPQ